MIPGKRSADQGRIANRVYANRLGNGDVASGRRAAVLGPRRHRGDGAEQRRQRAERDHREGIRAPGSTSSSTRPTSRPSRARSSRPWATGRGRVQRQKADGGDAGAIVDSIMAGGEQEHGQLRPAARALQGHTTVASPRRRSAWTARSPFRRCQARRAERRVQSSAWRRLWRSRRGRSRAPSPELIPPAFFAPSGKTGLESFPVPGELPDVASSYPRTLDGDVARRRCGRVPPAPMRAMSGASRRRAGAGPWLVRLDIRWPASSA